MRLVNTLLLGCLSSIINLSSAEVCLCDTTLACDLLCCCDPDCSDDDKVRFTCATTVTTSGQADVTCVSQSIFSRISPDSSFTFLRVKDDNCFTSTKLSASSSSIESVRAESSVIELQNSLVPVTYTSSFRNITSRNETIMKANDLLYTRDKLISRPLVLPAGFRGQCVQDSVLFLRNSTSSCTLQVTNDVCKAGSKIDSSLYTKFIVVKNFRKSVNETVAVTSSCKSTDGSVLDPCPIPARNGNTCENVVTKIELNVVYGKEEISGNISLGIISAEVVMTLESLPISASSFSRLLTVVHFNGNSQDYPNIGPKYQRYKPGYELLFNVKDTKQPFAPFQGDQCTTSRLTFPRSSIQSCVKTIGDLSTTDLTALTKDLFDPLPTALAKYHNSDLANPSEWLKFSWDVPETVESSSTPMNLILTVTHRSYGNKLNPENEILSATAAVSSTDLEYLNREGVVKDKLVFYFTLRFVSVDVESSKDNNIISKLSRSLANYFSYQRDSVPLQLFAIAVVIFVLLTLGILVNDQGKPQF